MRQAFISVSHKEAIFPLATLFNDYGIRIIASDGTANALQEKGLPAMAMSQYLDCKPMLGGRVKTLHPRLFGGILAQPDNPAHQLDMDIHQIEAIDFVVVDLYPFEQYMNDPLAAVENIDIGGVALIRAAAKNFQTCTIVCNENDYESLAKELQSNQGHTSLSFRQSMAAQAFQKTAHYDQQIATWFVEQSTKACSESIQLMYGENPHQQASFYLPDGVQPMIQSLQGKPLSYNNLLDLDAGIKLATDVDGMAAAVIKHTNPCGVARGDTPIDVITRAFQADQKSAYGGIVVYNTCIDEQVALFLKNYFIDVLAAPQFTPTALSILATKEKLRVIQYTPSLPNKEFATVLNGILMQTTNQQQVTMANCTIPTRLKPEHHIWPTLLFAATVVKHMKSNAIAIVKEKMSIGLSSGQTNRVDAIEAAILRAKHHNLIGAVLASDGFLPFADNIERMASSGIQWVIQPGGSIRDAEVIKCCDQHGIGMVMTGMRQFKH